MNKTILYTLGFVVILAVAGFFLWPYAFTVVTIEQVEQKAQSEAFDPISYVDGQWATKIVPTVEEQAKDLKTVLAEMEPGPDGKVPKAELIKIAEKYGLITVGEAHAYMVKGEGVVSKIDTSKSTGLMQVTLDGYDGPILVSLYIGPRIPSDETAVRDAVGFITFGDFKEQTEYGKVASEINKRVNAEVLSKLTKDQLQGKRIKFYGALMIRTFNLINIDLKQVNVVPVKIEIQ
jgi:predicted lipoprotein